MHLYIQYDEHDNAATAMMTHSATAWEHVTFKDVIVRVSNVDVYYRALSFYLAVRLGWKGSWLQGRTAGEGWDGWM